MTDAREALKKAKLDDLIYPEFPEGATGTDYNELAALHGLAKAEEVIKGQIERALSASASVSGSKPSETPQNNLMDFIPFEQSNPLPSFPLEALPQATRTFVFCAAEMVQAPVEMVGSPRLFLF